MKRLFKISAGEHGKGTVIVKWQPEGNLLATAGQNGLVHIFDRHGQRVDEISLQGQGQILSLDWDVDGECLAVLQEGNGVIPLWDSSSRSTLSIDTNLKDPTFMAWSAVGPQLAVGTAKGNILMYNKKTRKKIPVLGKHPRRITCGAWGEANQLVLGSVDSTLTVSTETGDTLEQTQLKRPPTAMCFVGAKRARSSRGRPSSPQAKRAAAKAADEHVVVAVNLSGKHLLLYSLGDPDRPVELAFQTKYGSIVVHRQFGDNYLLLGFSEGYLVLISTRMSEIGEEQFSGRFFKGGMTDVSYSPELRQAVAAGPTSIKVVNMRTYKEISEEQIPTSTGDGGICGLAWCPDGQILTVATAAGDVFNFLARMPTVHASFGSCVAYLSSLRQVSVVDAARSGDKPLNVPVSIEPTIVGLGPAHVAVAMNDRAIFYRATRKDKSQAGVGFNYIIVDEREYNGRVIDVRLNSTCAAVLSGTKVILQRIELDGQGAGDGAAGRRGRSSSVAGAGVSHAGGAGGGGAGIAPGPGPRRTFPEREDREHGEATAIGLTEAFLVYATKAGTVEFFCLSEWAPLAGVELKHSSPVLRLWPNYLGTRVVFVDGTSAGWLYSPASDMLTQIGGFPPNCRHCMWDQVDRDVLMVSDGKDLHTYVHSHTTIRGSRVTKLGLVEISEDGGVALSPESTPLPPQHAPVVSYRGAVTCQMQTGDIASFVAAPYEHANAGSRAPSDVWERCFLQNLALLRLKQAWRAALQLDERRYWLALSNKAMEVLDVQMAVHVYRQLGDAGMVMGLEQIAYVEDKNLLAGHIALLFGNYQTAQVPELCVEYGQLLEFRGSNDDALAMFESALSNSGSSSSSITEEEKLASFSGATGVAAGGSGDNDDNDDDDEDVVTAREQEARRAVCLAGIARCTLRSGDLRKGLRLARGVGSPQLFRECAGILEGMKQPMEAAAMYELGGQDHRAAAIYVAAKDLDKAATVMPRVTQPKLLGQYAKACEITGRWEQALEAYERARDMDSVVQLCLEQLDRADRAFAIVRENASSTGAEMVSRHCQNAGDWEGAIEFLLMAKRTADAFSLAKSHAQMDTFTKVLGTDVSPDDALSVARFYEQQHELGKAGKFYSLCGQHHRALKLFLQCGKQEVEAAIAVVGKARNDMLTHTLIDFLMGETDGVPKDPNYIYRLYMALGSYSQAAKTAIIIAKQEQDLGNYKVAHGILFETIRQLEDQGTHVPQSLRRSFVLLHSYILVKKMVRRGDHEGAARMLLRVARSISRFPTHIVPVLTSTVIECQRSGLRNSAFEYASTLMRQEHRGQIDKKYRRNIEAIVRRPNRDEEPEPTSKCPISSVEVPITQLECPSTKDALPMCVVTGQHMVKEDWCICPRSKMPALMSHYEDYLQYEQANAAKPDGSSVVEEQAADAAAAAAATAGEESGGASTRGLGYTGTDPVTGQLVRSGELVKSTPAEVTEYLKHYNELDDGEENDRDRDGVAAAADGGGGAENVAGWGGGSGPGAVNEAFGGGDGVLNDARDSKNSEGRAKDSAPVASAGAGPYRHVHSGMPAAA
eukprot:g7961.t1